MRGAGDSSPASSRLSTPRARGRIQRMKFPAAVSEISAANRVCYDFGRDA